MTAARIGKRAVKVGKPALTPWFSLGVNPVRVGVYETMLPISKYSAFQAWNGYSWGRYAFKPEYAALRQNAIHKSRFQSVQWRGLAADPSKAAK